MSATVTSESSGDAGDVAVDRGTDAAGRRELDAGSVVAWFVVGRRQQWGSSGAEAAGDALDHADDRRGSFAQSVALLGEEQLELLDVRLEEVTSGLECIDLPGDGDALGLADTASFCMSLVEQLGCHLASGVERGGRLVIGGRTMRAASPRASAIVLSAVRCASSSVRLIVSDSSARTRRPSRESRQQTR